MKYVISLTRNVRVPLDVNTKASSYPVVSYRGFRKFKSREQARAFKRTYQGSPVSIINVEKQQVVR